MSELTADGTESALRTGGIGWGSAPAQLRPIAGLFPRVALVRLPGRALRALRSLSMTEGQDDGTPWTQP